MKKSLALMLAVAMLASMSLSSFAAVETQDETTTAGGTITGENEVKNAIYSVQVPKKLSFAVDAFQKSEVNGQIYSLDFPIVNKSDVAIAATITPYVSAKAGLGGSGDGVQATAADAKPEDTTDTKKKVFLQVIPATTATASVEAANKAVPTSATYTRPVVDDSGVGNSDRATTVVQGSAVATTAKPKVTLNLAKHTFKDDNIGTAGYTGGIYVLTIKDNSGKVIGQVESGPVTDEPTDEKVALAFKGKELVIDGVTLKDDTISSGTTLTFTNAADLTTTSLGAAGTYELSVKQGTPAAVTIALDGESAPTYPSYDVDTGSSSAYATTLTDGDSGAKPLTFLLQKGDYIADYKDDKEKTLFSDLAADNKGVASFRLMGTINPQATWADKDFEVTAKYAINGVASTDYDKAAFAPDVQNVKSDAGSPTVAIAGAYTGSGAVVFNITGDTKEKVVTGLKSIKLVNETFASGFDVKSMVTLDTEATPKTLTFAADSGIHDYVVAGAAANELQIVFADGSEAKIKFGKA